MAELARRELARRQQPNFYERANTAIRRKPLGPIAALGEVGLNLATGAVGGLAGEAAATGVAAYNQGRNDQSLTPDRVASGIAGAMTYQPRTEMGKAAVGGIQKALSPLGPVIERIANPTGGGTEFGEHLTKTLLSVLPVDRIAIAPVAGAARPFINATVDRIRKAGFVMEPRQVIQGQHVGTPVERAAMGWGGKAAVPAQASIDNQPLVQRLVSEEFGLPSGEYLTKDVIASRIKAPANAAYAALGDLKNAQGQPFTLNLARDGQYLGAVRKIRQSATEGVTGAISGSVDAITKRFARPKQGVSVSDVMTDVRQLRSDARGNFLSDDPKIVAEAKAQLGLANALEDAIDRQVSPRNPQAVAKWRDARRTLAKLHTVEDAMVGTGEIDGRLIARARERGAPLTGNLALIADAADVSPRTMQVGANLGNIAHQGSLDALAGVGTAGLWNVGKYASKQVALGAGQGVRQMARLPSAAALSEAQQDQLRKGR